MSYDSVQLLHLRLPPPIPYCFLLIPSALSFVFLLICQLNCIHVIAIKRCWFVQKSSHYIT